SSRADARRSWPRTDTGRRGRPGSTTSTRRRSSEWGRPRSRSSRAQRSASVRDGLHLAQARQPPERLDFDLPDALAREAQTTADLLERLRLEVGEAVAQHEHLPLALAEG